MIHETKSYIELDGWIIPKDLIADTTAHGVILHDGRFFGRKA